MMTHRKFLETCCPNLARDCDAAVESQPCADDPTVEEDVLEAYWLGYSDAGKVGTIFALIFGAVCLVVGFMIGGWL